MKNFTAEKPVAYFSAEFGLEAKLPVYAGGLGILAGDILKEAADLKWNMVGVGLLYRGEEAVQFITPEGNQVELNNNYIPSEVGLELIMDGDQPLYIKVNLTQMEVWVQVWKYKVGETVDLYLLDPDNERNHSHERRLAYALYAGTEEEIIKQQIILGIGGVKLLHALNLRPTLYHVNEGRPSFLHWQLIRSMMDHDGLNYKQAKAKAKDMTVYTNHTVVAAGNQTYDIDYMKVYGKYYAGKMGIKIEDLLKDGQIKDRFDVTTFALNISRKASSVSEPHFTICKKQWPKYNWCNVTNGVHLPTWQDQKIAEVAKNEEELWHAHCQNKRHTMEYLQSLTGFVYDPDKLVITWARRMTTYKQLDKLFDDIAAMKTLLLSTEWPVQLLVAGKAHVFDTKGKQIIREVIGYMAQELAGHALFIPNYNIEIGKAITRGSDVWINTPIYGEEASGTSGMKAINNGVLQCTVADGWCREVDWRDETIGWALDHNRLTDSFFETMSGKIVPRFYQRNEHGVPTAWVKMMQKSIELGKHYGAARMLHDYESKLYV